MHQNCSELVLVNERCYTRQPIAEMPIVPLTCVDARRRASFRDPIGCQVCENRPIEYSKFTLRRFAPLKPFQGSTSIQGEFTDYFKSD
ncbi:hypothetical protein OsccyDRAFT_2680 [Leptolyngbyaceae cyanobacterium JSC-12]|nr:hypothetical protein OsccyDRAFT_2680 [Leptolyngbyaceae cyanobacterium JSC-12]